jgi:hypothetical protein
MSQSHTQTSDTQSRYATDDTKSGTITKQSDERGDFYSMKFDALYALNASNHVQAPLPYAPARDHIAMCCSLLSPHDANYRPPKSSTSTTTNPVAAPAPAADSGST